MAQSARPLFSRRRQAAALEAERRELLASLARSNRPTAASTRYATAT